MLFLPPPLPSLSWYPSDSSDAVWIQSLANLSPRTFLLPEARKTSGRSTLSALRVAPTFSSPPPPVGMQAPEVGTESGGREGIAGKGGARKRIFMESFGACAVAAAAAVGLLHRASAEERVVGGRQRGNLNLTARWGVGERCVSGGGREPNCCRRCGQKAGRLGFCGGVVVVEKREQRGGAERAGARARMWRWRSCRCCWRRRSREGAGPSSTAIPTSNGWPNTARPTTSRYGAVAVFPIAPLLQQREGMNALSARSYACIHACMLACLHACRTEYRCLSSLHPRHLNWPLRPRRSLE